MSVICKVCKSVDDFNIKKAGPHKTAYCNFCGAYIKHLPKPKTNVTDVTLFFGKYAGSKICDMFDEEEINYLKWLQEQDFVKENLICAIGTHLHNIGKL